MALTFKICTKCSIKQELNEFRLRSYGHINQCKTCERNFNKNWRKNNKKHLKTYNKNYKKEYFKEVENVTKVKKQQKNWRKRNNKYIKSYYKNYRPIFNVSRNNRRKNDILYRLSSNVRTLICNSISRGGYTKKTRSHEILGCTYKQFVQHLETYFEPWMNWDNYGKYNGELNFGWDIDHIEPLSSAKTEEDVIRLNYYTNLKPLCSYTNRYIKRDR